ncbi:MAG: nicotinate-nucleotide adenylyltransferase [Sphingobacteriales bacterium]|nr:nicotinate-nucleotide adenylyltransferase [Sphingobacteriales bacterium]MBI3720311.1 nicotinate-nucleotide adenylyltransferase [Sphingobacteriales bacterium]
MKVALYFGSFNPIHHGHLIIANHIVENTDTDQVWFVVSPQNPFKQSSALLNEYQRLHLINIAIDGEQKLKASNIEFNLPKPSYTVNTLAYLKEKYPETLFVVLMGSDSFQNISKWKNADVILKNYPLYVYRRPGFEITETLNTSVTIVEAPLLQISATHIRELVKAGKSIRYLVPDTVMDEIIKGGYYK